MLAEIGAEEAALIEAWNKVDLLAGEEAARVRAEAARRKDVVVLSALDGEGVDDLLACAAGHLRKGATLGTVTVPAADGEAIAWLHANGEVAAQRTEGMETTLEVRLSDRDWARFRARQTA